MDKDSIIELQKIDCNCNDCTFMIRDKQAFTDATEFHRIHQFDSMELKKKKLLKAAALLSEKGKYNEATLLVKESQSLKVVLQNKGGSIQYGHCGKFEKKVSFIPNVCQLETQQCFKHRRS